MKKLPKFTKLYFRLWKKHQIPMRASALTYTFILGLVPAIAMCLSVFSVFVDMKSVQGEITNFLLRNLATGTGSNVTQYLEEFIHNVRFRALGFVGFAALLVTSLLLLSNIEKSVNHIWSIRSSKKIWHRVVTYNLILIFGPLCLALSLFFTAFVKKYEPHYLVHVNIGATLVNTLFLTLIYKIMPNRKVHWGGALISGFLVAVASESAKWAYTIYTAKTLIYNKLYGGLAALPFFLIWIYLNWIIFLSGALLNFMIQNRKSFRTAGVETSHVYK